MEEESLKTKVTVTNSEPPLRSRSTSFSYQKTRRTKKIMKETKKLQREIEVLREEIRLTKEAKEMQRLKQELEIEKDEMVKDDRNDEDEKDLVSSSSSQRVGSTDNKVKMPPPNLLRRTHSQLLDNRLTKQANINPASKSPAEQQPPASEAPEPATAKHNVETTKQASNSGAENAVKQKADVPATIYPHQTASSGAG